MQTERENKNMSNNIKFLAENKSKFLTTKEYYGYGQILKISDDGIEKTHRGETKRPGLWNHH